MSQDRLAGASITICRITPKTQWIFIEMTSRSGLKGIGEATTSGREGEVIQAFQALTNAVDPSVDWRPGSCLQERPLLTLAQAAAFSAFDQALWDMAGQRNGRTVAAELGGAMRDAVPVYANINRRTLDRSAAGFAASARDATAAGFNAIKIAPFDEATPEERRAFQLGQAIRPGLDRVRAVRDAIGPERRLMIDCHWRLDQVAAETVIAAAAELGVYWVECPLPETPDHLQDLRRLRGIANRQGVKLAGCEEMIRREGFAPFLEAGCYDVIMPDAKYVGGLGEMLALAEIANRQGIEVSPHNPSGPIAHAASLHVCAAFKEPGQLEMQFDETPLFGALQVPPLPAIVGGVAPLPPRPGLGVALDPSLVNETCLQQWTAAF